MISGLILTFVWVYRILATKIFGRRNDDLGTQSYMLFIMQMPMFYFFRMPLILGLLTNIATLIDANSVRIRWEREGDGRPSVRFKSLKRHLLEYLKSNLL